MPERIRDAAVAEEIAAQAGTDATPELVLSDILVPVIFGPQRPPLAQSGYFSGTVGLRSAGVALNRSHVGIFGSGFGGAIVRVNWVKVMNSLGSGALFTLRRVDAPFTGFPSIRAIPGYINAGNPSTGRIFSITKSDTVAAQGLQLAEFRIEANAEMEILGPWVINDGVLLVANNTVETEMHAAFGYESWTAIRVQPPG